MSGLAGVQVGPARLLLELRCAADPKAWPSQGLSAGQASSGADTWKREQRESTHVFFWDAKKHRHLHSRNLAVIMLHGRGSFYATNEMDQSQMRAPHGLFFVFGKTCLADQLVRLGTLVGRPSSSAGCTGGVCRAHRNPRKGGTMRADQRSIARAAQGVTLAGGQVGGCTDEGGFHCWQHKWPNRSRVRNGADKRS